MPTPAAVAGLQPAAREPPPVPSTAAPYSLTLETDRDLVAVLSELLSPPPPRLLLETMSSYVAQAGMKLTMSSK